jgi:hypothetical protein
MLQYWHTLFAHVLQWQMLRGLLRVPCRYQLMHTVRVHTGADDDAYGCMGWGPDREGVNGVWLRKDVPLQVGIECCSVHRKWPQQVGSG